MLDVNWTMPVVLVSVIVYLILMNKFLFKPLLQFMEARDKGVRDNLDEAARLRREAEGALSGYDSALESARRDMTEQAATLQRAMEAKQREQIEQARTEAQTLTAESQATISRETEEARGRLRDTAQDLAQLVVVKLLGREVRR
jgi:F-type H+-transporting ATPase subunit b